MTYEADIRPQRRLSFSPDSEGHFMLLTSTLGENSAGCVIETLLVAKVLYGSRRARVLVCPDRFFNSLHHGQIGNLFISTWRYSSSLKPLWDQVLRVHTTKISHVLLL